MHKSEHNESYKYDKYPYIIMNKGNLLNHMKIKGPC